MNQNEFQIILSNEVTKYSDTLSKCRARIFYKYANRNFTYITDEFAEQLLTTLPYAPVKGIFSHSNDDFTDHGLNNDLGKIYGIVPENPNISWEKFLDEDGVEREYACADVLLFTALYKEANEIRGKSLSLEMYQDTIEGQWQIIKGQKYYVFSKGSFLGLQTLGEKVEPCFEGAAFYTLMNSLNQVTEQLKNFNLQDLKQLQNFNLANKKEEKPEMKLKFNVSDAQKHNAIWNLLNTNFNEEGEWTVDYSIDEVYDEYAIVFKYADNSKYRVYYTKDNENDTVTLGKMEKVYPMDLLKDEYDAILNMRKSTKCTAFSDMNTQIQSILDKSKVDFSEVANKIEEISNNFEKKTEEYDTLKLEKNDLSTKYSDLFKDNEILTEFKKQVETDKKQDIISKYSKEISSEIIDKFTKNIADYTIENLEKELAFELVKSKPSLFSLNSNKKVLPKEDQTDDDDILDILDRNSK